MIKICANLNTITTMKKNLLLLFFAYSLSAACEEGLWLNAVDLNKDSTMATLFAAIDDSLYEKMKKTEWNELNGCMCEPGGIFVQSRHTDLMERGWHFNYCSTPDSVVRYEDEANNSKDLIVQTNLVLFDQIQSLKKLVKEKGCKPDSVYEFSESEVTVENAQKGIYVSKLPIPREDIRVPKNVRLLKVYFPDGKLFREIQFSLGLRNGYDKRYFPTGVKYIVNQYKNGLMDGNQIQYYPSGKKDFEVKFKNGKHVGFYKQYSRKNGSVSIEKIDGNTEFGW